MTTISSLWYMILIELLIATTLVSVVLIGLKFVRGQKDRAAAAILVQKLKEDGGRRKEETKKLLQDKFGFESAVAEEIATKARREERKFYQYAINFYLRRDAMSFENLNIDFEGAVDAYRSLEPPGVGGGSTEEVVATDESGEIRRLTIENKRLSDEVGVTMQTMSRMMDEFSSMFAGGAESEGADAEVEPDMAEDVVAESEAERALDDTEELDAEEFSEEPHSMVEGMDDLSDLDPKEHDDLGGEDELENPDELLG